MQPLDRRSSVRIATQLPARLQTADGSSHAAVVRDISLSGMQIQLHGSSVPGVLLNVNHERLRMPVEVLVECELDDALRPSSIVVRCGIAHLRRIAVDQCVIGVSFRMFLDDGEHRLAQYWLSKMSGRSDTMNVE
jgi:PilZ domain